MSEGSPPSNSRPTRLPTRLDPAPQMLAAAPAGPSGELERMLAGIREHRRLPSRRRLQTSVELDNHLPAEHRLEYMLWERVAELSSLTEDELPSLTEYESSRLSTFFTRVLPQPDLTSLHGTEVAYIMRISMAHS